MLRCCLKIYILIFACVALSTFGSEYSEYQDYMDEVENDTHLMEALDKLRSKLVKMSVKERVLFIKNDPIVKQYAKPEQNNNWSKELPAFFNKIPPESYNTVLKNSYLENLVYRIHKEKLMSNYDFYHIYYLAGLYTIPDVLFNKDLALYDSPPSKIDVIAALYFIADINEYSGNKDNTIITGKDFFRKYINEWPKLENAKNPLYRLVFVRAAEHIYKGERLRKIYENAFNEKNSIFWVYAIQGLKKMGTSEAKQAIADFLKKHDNDGSWIKGECVMQLGYDAIKSIGSVKNDNNVKQK